MFLFLSDGTVSVEDKGLDDDSDIDNDEDIFGLLSQDYIVDKQEVPNIDDLDESIVPILAHKDSRNFQQKKNLNHRFTTCNHFSST